ncbi:hypothetical protein [Streptococcus saliviloxodontae]|uniref:Yip1 domain-containing protein n=1 Tax=Streptococcus saliviloxodontae TaxID=1349416 RepID=A0ABS2PNM8_9STRE|nr:hypothetical protein [Streptococcus saliviloxodontae]MBM7637043.1 hypothetical protein [Streptococcus saliviloxodontae]
MMKKWNNFLNFWKAHHIVLLILYCSLYTLLTYILTSQNVVNIDETLKTLHNENADAAEVAKIIGTIIGLMIAFITPFITIIFLSLIYWISSVFLSIKLTYQKIFNSITECYIVVLLMGYVNLGLLILTDKTIPKWIDILNIQNDILRIFLDNVSLLSIFMLYMVGLQLKIKNKNWKQVLLTTLLVDIFYVTFKLVGA